MHKSVYGTFYPMWQYAWHKSGYIESRPEKFLNVNEALFELNVESCDVLDCDEHNFLQFAHCRKILCFNHFFVAYHYHTE